MKFLAGLVTASLVVAGGSAVADKGKYDQSPCYYQQFRTPDEPQKRGWGLTKEYRRWA